MSDRGLSLSLRAIHRQLAAMPCPQYLIRLIHHRSRRALPGSRLWTASQLGQEAIVKFLQVRNGDDYDVYFQPYAAGGNAGYILLDLDQAGAGVVEARRVQGHQPCVVVETSPGHLQAWVHVSTQPLAPRIASAMGRELARLYHGDPASSDWRHVGRLAGFTNQKPCRRLPSGLAPWVKLLRAMPGLARRSRELLHSASCSPQWFAAPPAPPPPPAPALPPCPQRSPYRPLSPSITAVCNGCASRNVFLSRTGVSPTSGSPKNCCTAVSPPPPPPRGQSRFSAPPCGTRRLLAPHPHPRPHRQGRRFSCAPQTCTFAVSARLCVYPPFARLPSSAQSPASRRQPDASAACQIFGPFCKSKFLFQSLPRRPPRDALAAFPAAEAFVFSATAHSCTGK